MREQVSELGGVAAPSASAEASAGRRAWRRRLLMVGAGLLVLRGVQAAIAGLTVLTVTAAHLAQPAPRLRVARLAEVSPDPLTAVTALVMIAVSATLAAVLLPRRWVFAAFAGIKAFAVLAATTVTAAIGAGSVGPRLAIAGCGVALVLMFWPSARDAAVRVLTALGLPHPPGRVGDLLVAVKIVLLVLIVAVPA
jgi:hypothetical protein